MSKVNWDEHRRAFIEQKAESGITVKEYCEYYNLPFNTARRELNGKALAAMGDQSGDHNHDHSGDHASDHQNDHTRKDDLTIRRNGRKLRHSAALEGVLEPRADWEVLCKGFRLGNEEALAGEHAAHILLILDEASGISDKAIAIMRGALTETDNRMLMMSQPTRPSGYFYDSHHSFARNPDNPDGIWNAIVLNSEEAPHVTLKFIREKLLEYGGRDSLEYMVKVLGRFPRNISGYLLGRDECDRAARRKVYLEKGWGWVATADVGNGRDKSILNICRVSGHGDARRVVSFKLVEMPGTMDPISFGDFIANECTQERYPGITIAVDGDGVGSATLKQLERRGVNAVNIRWGQPPFSKKVRERFKNQRAWANIMAADAVRSGRMRIDASQHTAEQGSKIPYYMDEMGRIMMVPKPQMRQKLNIKSPDRWDTYCFIFLIGYRPAEAEIDEGMADFAESKLKELEELDALLA